ncbi:MAG: glycosyltransferase, partial [Actinobacteria bacterium]|nr:glycosyltransferase [Actinomycetota bacterium]
CGTPCVGTRVGGIPEVLTAPACGRIVPPEDPDALAAALEEVVGLGRNHFEAACIANAAPHDSKAKAAQFLAALERMLP